MSKEIISKSVQESILSTHKVILAAFHKFVEERVTGSENLWAKMTKVKLSTWKTAAKDIKRQTKSEILKLKATSSLFARMLVIAQKIR